LPLKRHLNNIAHFVGIVDMLGNLFLVVAQLLSFKQKLAVQFFFLLDLEFLQEDFLLKD